MLCRRLDCLFVNPGAANIIYQDLSKRYSAIEPPTWSLLLAQACRSKGFGTAILDLNAERITEEQAIQRVKECDPRLVCFTVYGQNPNSGTTEMTGATSLAKKLRQRYPEYKICFVGSHTSALPLDVLSYPFVDFVLLNEGVYALQHLLSSNLKDCLGNINGIGYKEDGGILKLNDPEKPVPTNRMDVDLPGYAWDLLPYEEKPLDLYRSHFWHADWQDKYRTPFAAIYTSLGCPFKCDFCMINILNRVDNSPNVTAANSAYVRFWSPEFIIKEFDKLVKLGVYTMRISDELFFFRRNHFESLLKLLKERDYAKDLRMWAYARIDIANHYKDFSLFEKAGIKALGFGIESSSNEVRENVSKGAFDVSSIKQAISKMRDFGMIPGVNYIFGLPKDTIETMQETLDLSLELCTENWNAYACYALPGSPLYMRALKLGWKLPTKYSEYSFFSYDSLPLPTNSLPAADVLEFRDNAFHTYYKHKPFINLIEKRFGQDAKRNIIEMEKVRLKRKIVEEKYQK